MRFMGHRYGGTFKGTDGAAMLPHAHKKLRMAND